MKKLFALAAIAVAATGVQAQDFPAGKPVTLVVPFAAGGPTDKVARDLAEALTRHQDVAAAFKDHPKASIVLIPGAPHTLLNLPAARQVVAGYLQDALK